LEQPVTGRLAGAGLLVIAATASGTSAQAPVTVPIELINNFPVLEVDVGGRSVAVMFDLGGSDEIVLSKVALASLRVERRAETYAWVDAKGNRLESQTFRIPELRIGSLVLRDVTGHEDAEAATYRKTPAGVGYIGAALVRTFKLVVDYGQRSMTFIPNGIPNPEQHGCFGTEVPFDPAMGGEPITKAVTDLGELVLVWDTGAPMSLVRESNVKARGFTPDGLYIPTSKFELAGEDFGPMQLRLFSFAEPAEVDGFVGHDFFAHHVVCIDLGGQRFLVRSSANSRQPLPQPGLRPRVYP
jgi:hypothetical protein